MASKTKTLADLTVEEFKALMREALREALKEATQSDGEERDWETGVEVIMQRFDEALQRLANL